MSRHAWMHVEGGQWCRACGTYRAGQEVDDETGEQFYTFYDVGSEPRKVVSQAAEYDPCGSFPRGYMDAIFRWLDIRERWGRRPVGADQFHADLGHSALFRRILAGQEVFPEPPPLSHSYPNYPLIERGWDEPISVWMHDALGKGKVVIDQHPWHVIEQRGDEEWVVTYLVPDREKLKEAWRGGKRPSERVAERTVPSKTRWHVRRVGSRIYFDKNGQRFEMNQNEATNKLWRIDRLPDAD